MNDLTVNNMVTQMLSLESVWSELPVLDRRARIEEFHRRVDELAAGKPYVPPIQHFFGDNTYGRQLYAQTGAVIVGGLYKEPQVNVLIRGVVFVATEEKIGILEAPLTFVSDANTKKVGYVLEDMHWITIVSRDNDNTDPEDIMKGHTTDTYGG